MAKVIFPDGKAQEVEKGTKFSDLLEVLPSKIRKKMLAVKWNDKLYDLSAEIPDEEGRLEFISYDTEEGKEILYHSSSHIMAQAVKRLYPDVKVTIGPAIETGFYYDFLFSSPISENDLEKIEKEIKKIQEENYTFERETITKEEALELFKDNPFKVEIIKEIEDSHVSIYKQGEFVDLCRGPHVPSTGFVKHIKLLSIAGAYWRGDEKREMLTRIYGIAFQSEKEMKEYLKNLEEAKKRDHRVLGKQLELFSIFPDEGGAGLVYWLPKGATLRRVIEDFWKEEHIKRGYQMVYIPHIARAELWKTSGHYDFYKENMYTLEIDEQEYVLKPMNCPGHILIYKTKIHSYKELPIRFAELGTVYRYERSGVLHGMLRVRGFTQDDGHIFCTPQQLPQEIKDTVQFAIYMMNVFGYNDFKIELSARDPKNPDKYAGTEDEWHQAEKALEDALKDMGLEYTRMEGEAVFYGPKIDFKLKDALGRYWQGPTIQFDFNLPRRFNVTYIGEDNKPHQVFMVHRALLGSLERFIGGLIEHYAGNFPVWLSPVQVAVLPISEKHLDYSKKIVHNLNENNLRVVLYDSSDKISAKIRKAETEKIPYMLIIGDREAESGKVSVRKHREGDLGSLSIEEFIERIKGEIEEKK